ncbi:PQQ-dependent sugar dehydrogenase [Smaragdicoccus niigatensis]|uniref:PQQ-dependent sugar dehydrogenase n=1 Tax=Smaragdicoccus niigatensis TaxID=359359 RepID=UPI0003A66ECF|nr:PQQ-dependent sugar dehydrogenase [Smaragdicoccus niigatensis]
MEIRHFVRLTVSVALAAGALSVAVPANAATALPTLSVTAELSNLDRPWDAIAAPDGTIITGEKTGRFVLKETGGAIHSVAGAVPGLWVSGETGLMGLALATDFSTTRRLFACHGYSASGTTDIRISAFTIGADWNSVTYAGSVLTGIDTDSGRHGGCRILAHPDGTLYVGTGDAAVGTNPQDPTSLAGKVLHITTSGQPAPGNPTASSPIFTLGHRNVQGLAMRVDTGFIYSVEHGTDRDDEINRLVPGGNYGWRPDRTAYDETVPMTDKVRVPGALDAIWSSGEPTLATSGAAVVQGAAWGGWGGALAVATLKAQKLMLVKLGLDGQSVTETAFPPALNGTNGRLRSVTSMPDGSLLITTDASPDGKVLRVRPVENVSSPTLTGTPPRGLVKRPYDFQFAVGGGPTTTTRVTSGALPAGLSLSSTGKLSGVPTKTGYFNFRVTASNSAGAVTKLYRLQIATQQASITGSPPAGTVGVPYRHEFTVTGAPPPVVSLASGQLPPGLTISSSGVLEGTPSVAGEYRFSLRADNGVGFRPPVFAFTLTIRT